jgi:hypothetical protein
MMIHEYIFHVKCKLRIYFRAGGKHFSSLRDNGQASIGMLQL